jgi:hypothetical protein
MHLQGLGTENRVFHQNSLAAEGDCAHEESFKKLLKWNYLAYIGKRMSHGSNLSSLTNLLERPYGPLSTSSVIVRRG